MGYIAPQWSPKSPRSPLEAYTIVTLGPCGISQGARKLIRTSTLNKFIFLTRLLFVSSLN